MNSAAAMWIRDGVLVDRMHINPVAFAFSYWLFLSAEQRNTISLEALINFGFEKSGLSCRQKMDLFNEECGGTLADCSQASAYYNLVATEAARSCSFFPGACELLGQLQSNGVHNFITSAVEQQVLDQWLNSAEAADLKPSLDEVLGKRPGCTKGRGHFAYVARKHAPIYLIADAKAEIEMGAELAAEFNIITVGFAHVISAERVMEATQLVFSAYKKLERPEVVAPIQELTEIDATLLASPHQDEVSNSLTVAGAERIVTGSGAALFSQLGELLREWKVLPAAEEAAR